MQRKIRKAKLKSRSLEVELNETIETEGGPVTNEIIMKCAGLAHDDLKKAFDRLTLHMVMICDLRKSELISVETFESDEALKQFEDYSVTGFSIGGEEEHEGLVIFGSRKFPSGKVLNITTPFTKFSDDNDPYVFEAELYNDIQACLYEVEQYLEGKFAIKQLELPFDETPVMEEVDAA
ncbi:MAG: hypothetical protein Q8R90_04925 [Bacteroidales bacterium]|nr:hypothetical protein [Bacteroidales bacterium]